MTSARDDPTAEPADVEAVADASRLIQELLAERRRVENMQQEFLSILTHELRTPLAAMMGALGLLRNPRLAAEPQRMDELIGIAERNGGRLLRLINDLLDLQRLEAGALPFHLGPVPVSELLDDAAGEVRELAGHHKVKVLIEAAPAAVCLVTDRERLAQVLRYLLSNAVKFSPARGEVVVAGRLLDAGVEITVRDHGPGIPAFFKTRLFESFAQAEPASVRNHGGVGLGLSISKKIVEGLGGQITFDSAPDRGTTVTVRLPQQTV